MRHVAILFALLAGCPKQPASTGVLTEADVRTLRDGQAMTAVLAALPRVQNDPDACRGFVYVDAAWTQVVQIAEALQTAPTCFDEIRIDATACPALAASDPIVTEAVAQEVRQTTDVLDTFIDVVAAGHPEDPVVEAWAVLASKRIGDLTAEVVSELAVPDDLLLLNRVCHAE
jgi:hypothetical protein